MTGPSFDGMWAPEDLARALVELAVRSGLPRRDPAPVPAAGDRAVDDRVGEAAEWVGLEAIAVETTVADLDDLVARVHPAILRLPPTRGRPAGLAVVLDARSALTPDGRVVPRPAWLARDLAAPVTDALRPGVETVVDRAGLVGAARGRAVDALLGQAASGERLAVGWIVRRSVASPLTALARESGLGRLAAEVVVLHLAQLALMLLGWGLVGRAALSGRFDPGLVTGWGVLLLSLIPIRMRELVAQGQLAAGAGLILKRRTLRGALALDPSVVRREGMGGLLARVHEAEAVEALGTAGGMLGGFAILDLIASAWVVGQGVGGWAHAALLAGWVGGVLVAAARMHRAAREWTTQRLATTHVLGEQMAGHRTRLVQQAPARWHDGDDTRLAEGWARSAELDRRIAQLRAVAPQGWMIASVLWLGPTMVRGASPGELAVAVGGTIFARAALDAFVGGLIAVSGAAIGWRQLGPMLSDLRPPERPPHGPVPVDGRLVEARDLTFRYPSRSRSTLAGCDLRLDRGDRILVQGPSGGGKSTLVSLLVGLRVPDSGMLLLHGLDLPTLGPSAWRRAAVSAPQFHENHVLTGTFGFNVLMGRGWPPTPEDLELAAAVCADLGLGELLERMPGRMWQIVGETGWQLSHGEQSRLFLARALVQDAELVVLDETLAALDPPNVARCLATARARARTLVVVAHP